MLRWFRWQLAKEKLGRQVSLRPPTHLHVLHQFHQRRVDEFTPDAKSYGRLAEIWEDYASWFTPDYGSFLSSAEAYYREHLPAVLDLGCGTGIPSRQLATRAKAVVGLDSSEDMILGARTRTAAGHVRYVSGDFRDFHLEGLFDAAVSGNDSLNYVEHPEELVSVFRSVGRHLRPGGLFVFDVLGHAAFELLGRIRTVVEVGRRSFEHYRFYDPVGRVVESRIVVDGTIEGHRRVQIERKDVRRAADASGLKVLEIFGESRREFYVLRVP
jgi:SAM-dependent methyltransferase